MTHREFDWREDENWEFSLHRDLLLTQYLFEDTHYPIARERIAKGISPASHLNDMQAFHQQRIKEITNSWLGTPRT